MKIRKREREREEREREREIKNGRKKNIYMCRERERKK